MVRRETEEGVWIFTPHVQSHNHSHRPHEPHGVIPSPSPPSDHRAYGEGSGQAEEARTIDPIVEPQDETTSRRRNRRRRARRTTAHEELSHALQTLRNALANKPQNSHPSRVAPSNSLRTWNSRMGPEPGVRFRKLPVWKLQIQSCIT